jgi:ribonuclease-3 family protein
LDLFNITQEEREISSHGMLALAHLGDSVYELMVRTWLITSSDLTNQSMHNEALKYVSAEAQFDAFQRIKDILSEEELDIVRRGRNARTKTVPKNVSHAKYHIATGLEALFGVLWLSGKHTRLNTLFEYIVR